MDKILLLQICKQRFKFRILTSLVYDIITVIVLSDDITDLSLTADIETQPDQTPQHNDTKLNNGKSNRYFQ